MSTPRTEEPETKYSVDLKKGEAPPVGFVRGRTVVLVCGVFVVALLGLNMFSTLQGNKRDDRRANDATNLWSTKTAHTFTDSADGIVETFVAASPTDTDTIDSIRRSTEALLLARRNVGDFSVNSKKNLVGREELEQSTENLKIVRAEIDGGVTFTYSSTKPELQKALKSWASSQMK